MDQADLDKTNSNLDCIVQLLPIDEYDVWQDYFYEFLSSAVNKYDISWKSIIIVSIQIKMAMLTIMKVENFELTSRLIF